MLIDNTFKYWIKTQTGDGVVTIANNVATCEATGTGRAQLTYYINIDPNSVIDFNFNYMIESTEGGESPVIHAQLYDLSGAYVSRLAAYELKKDIIGQWVNGSMRIATDSTIEFGSGVTLSIGVATNGGAKVKFAQPRLSSVTSESTLNCSAAAVVKIENGVASFDSATKRFGFDSVSITGNTITIVANKKLSTLGRRRIPTITEMTYVGTGEPAMFTVNRLADDNTLIIRAEVYSVDFVKEKIERIYADLSAGLYSFSVMLF